MVLCRILSRSSSVALRAAMAGFSRIATVKQPPLLLIYRDRRQFCTHKPMENNTIDKQELPVKRPSWFPFRIRFIDDGNVKGRLLLERSFDDETIEIIVEQCKEEEGHINLFVEIYQMGPIEIDLVASFDNFKLVRFLTGLDHHGSLYDDEKKIVLKCLQYRGIDKRTTDFLIGYMASLAR